jgi:hypothetical protein
VTAPACLQAPAPLRALLAIAVLAVTLIATSAEPANGKPILRGIYENLFLSTDQSARDRWFNETVEAGADVVSIGLSWKGITSTAGPPANPRDPADPAYYWTDVDAAVRGANSRGLQVMFVVDNAPAWAEGPGRPDWARAGTWKPDPNAFGAFAEAVGRRYSGSYADGYGPLPMVKYFEVWNEPNYAGFLTPQYESGRPFAPDHYRRLLNAFYDGLKRAHPSGKVAGPGTLPFGQTRGSELGIRPRAFIREVLCLDDRERREPGCGPTSLDILSHHPMNPISSPRAGTAHPDDITVSTMGRLIRTLRAAERVGTVTPAGRRPVWVSELWWFTRRPAGSGVTFRTPPGKQARYLEESLYLLWRQGVEAMIWFQIADDTGFPSGLFTPNGSKKPSYTAFSFPFVTERRSKRRVVIWGISPRTGKVTIQRKTGRGWRSMKSLRARDGRPFTSRLRLRGSAKLRAQVQGEKSLSWRQRG